MGAAYPGGYPGEPGGLQRARQDLSPVASPQPSGPSYSNGGSAYTARDVSASPPMQARPPPPLSTRPIRPASPSLLDPIQPVSSRIESRSVRAAECAKGAGFWFEVP